MAQKQAPLAEKTQLSAQKLVNLLNITALLSNIDKYVKIEK